MLSSGRLRTFSALLHGAPVVVALAPVRVAAGAMLSSGRRRAFSALLHDAPVVVTLAPVRVAVVEGTVYRWCACGRSSKQPWCDGQAHKATTIRPVVWTAPKSGQASLCGCRHSARRPLCDGAHAMLPLEESVQPAGS
jgi:CDGSH-type Zn-finger protein